MGIRWKNVNHSKQNTVKLPADLLTCQCSLGSLETELRTGLAAQGAGREPGDLGCVPGLATNPACDAGKSFSSQFPKPDFMPILLGTQREPKHPGFQTKLSRRYSLPIREEHTFWDLVSSDETGLKPAKEPEMLQSSRYYMIT